MENFTQSFLIVKVKICIKFIFGHTHLQMVLPMACVSPRDHQSLDKTTEFTSRLPSTVYISYSFTLTSGYFSATKHTNTGILLLLRATKFTNTLPRLDYKHISNYRNNFFLKTFPILKLLCYQSNKLLKHKTFKTFFIHLVDKNGCQCHKSNHPLH